MNDFIVNALLKGIITDLLNIINKNEISVHDMSKISCCYAENYQCMLTESRPIKDYLYKLDKSLNGGE